MQTINLTQLNSITGNKILMALCSCLGVHVTVLRLASRAKNNVVEVKKNEKVLKNKSDSMQIAVDYQLVSCTVVEKKNTKLYVYKVTPFGISILQAMYKCQLKFV